VTPIETPNRRSVDMRRYKTSNPCVRRPLRDQWLSLRDEPSLYQAAICSRAVAGMVQYCLRFQIVDRCSVESGCTSPPMFYREANCI